MSRRCDSRRQVSVIGMVINDLPNPFYVELAIGIEQVPGGAYIPSPTPRKARSQHQVSPMRETGQWACARAGDGDVGERAETLLAGLPVVQVMRRLPGLRASFVAPENKEGARKRRHLIAVGHRRVAFVGVSSMLVGRRGLRATIALDDVELRSIRSRR